MTTSFDDKRFQIFTALKNSGWHNVEYATSGLIAKSRSGRADLSVFINGRGRVYSAKISNVFTNREYIFSIPSIADAIGMDDSSTDVEVFSNLTPDKAVGIVQ